MQQVIEHGAHARAACLDAPGVLAACFVEPVAVVLREDFGEPAYPSQRGSQVMSDRVGEGLQVLVSPLQVNGAIPDLLFQVRVQRAYLLPCPAQTAAEDKTGEETSDGQDGLQGSEGNQLGSQVRAPRGASRSGGALEVRDYLPCIIHHLQALVGVHNPQRTGVITGAGQVDGVGQLRHLRRDQTRELCEVLPAPRDRRDLRAETLLVGWDRRERRIVWLKINGFAGQQIAALASLGVEQSDQQAVACRDDIRGGDVGSFIEHVGPHGEG
jgi:hypothetical protein